MATDQRVIYPHIEITPGVRAGKLFITGTRIAVVDVAIAPAQGVEPKEILTYFSSRPVTVAEVHRAGGSPQGRLPPSPCRLVEDDPWASRRAALGGTRGVGKEDDSRK